MSRCCNTYLYFQLTLAHSCAITNMQFDQLSTIIMLFYLRLIMFLLSVIGLYYIITCCVLLLLVTSCNLVCISHILPCLLHHSLGSSHCFHIFSYVETVGSYTQYVSSPTVGMAIKFTSLDVSHDVYI